MNDDQVRLEFDDFFCKTLRAIDVACGPAIIQQKVLALYPTKLLEPLFQGLHARPGFGILFTDPHQDANPRDLWCLLRTGCNRPRHCRSANKTNELAPLHLNTYSGWQT